MASTLLYPNWASGKLATPSLATLPKWKSPQTIATIPCNNLFSPKLKTSSLICSVSSLSLNSTDNQFLPTDKVEKEKTPLKENHSEEEHVKEKQLKDVWKDIQGCRNWEGLLDPMNPTLRREIIRYGEFAQACYDAFDFDPHSKYCGTCKYQGAQFFDNLDMQNRGYQISRYLYATSNINLPNFFQKAKISSVWSKHANWMGYVAVCTDEDEIKRLGRRDIVVSWRGTVTYLEWIHDLKDILHPACFRGDPSIKIESGFFDLYTTKEQECHYCSFSAREQLLSEIRRLVRRYDTEDLSITVTGHSLGAALALLSAYDIAEMRVNSSSCSEIPITVYSFSGPRVGNLKFKERCDQLGVKVLRVHNAHDKVPTMPGLLTNEKFKFQKYIEDISFPWSYAHVGKELALDHKKSPFLKSTGDMRCLHNLEALLHLVDGHKGKEEEFEVNERDIALVNKDCGFLKEEFDVPPHWRQDYNKGMVRSRDGRWIFPERPEIEGHPPDTAHHVQQVLDYVQFEMNSLKEAITGETKT
ncbi:Phospholipase A1-Igamma3 [Ranunculus cassubicifolius]